MKNPYDEKKRDRGTRAVSALRDILSHALESHALGELISSSEAQSHSLALQALRMDSAILDRDQVPGKERIPEAEQGYAVIVLRLNHGLSSLGDILHSSQPGDPCHIRAAKALENDRHEADIPVICAYCGSRIGTYSDYKYHEMLHEGHL